MYNLQTKRQCAVWLNPGASRSAEIRQQKSKVKTVLIANFDAKGLLHHEFIPPGQTVTSTVYLVVTKCLMRRTRQIWPEYYEPGSLEFAA